MHKKLKSILNLVIKNETNIRLISKLDSCLIDNNFEEHKKNIQQLQQLCDWVEDLKLVVINDKRTYKDEVYDEIINKIEDFVNKIRGKVLVLKIQ